MRASGSGPKKRLQIELTPEAHRLLTDIVRATGENSLVSGIRSAIKVYAWVISEQRRGNVIASVNRSLIDRAELSHSELVTLVAQPGLDAT